MASPEITVLLTSFTGLGLPPTLALRVPLDASVSSLMKIISDRIKAGDTERRLIDRELIITTNSNKELPPRSSALVNTFLSSPSDAFLPLRMSVPLCGGKGGFGSQLRAAGGRMSSRKKKNQGDANGSSRNLDGRRLRTVTEAKNLAEYLSLKPEMDKKEKEERRKRWEQIVEMAERKEQEIKSGSSKNARLSEQWMESKDEAAEKTREAVLAALKAGEIKNAAGVTSDHSGSGSGNSEGSEDDSENDDAEAGPVKPVQRSFFGWDEDEDDLSDEDEELSDEEESEEEQAEPAPIVGKGKGRA